MISRWRSFYSDRVCQNAILNDENLDMNGRGRIKRKLNHRATWNLDQTEPIAGNYYPSKQQNLQQKLSEFENCFS